MNQVLIEKYNKNVPRYTSYPTIVDWEKSSISTQKWLNIVADQYNIKNEISLYIHIPFCEALCTYCGCNKVITTNHGVEERYIQTLLKEWKTYLGVFQSTPVLKELHLGGGTPTFLSPQNLEFLVSSILKDCILAQNYTLSIEVHPNFTTEQHIIALANLKFNRISLGVQDFDPIVQKAIHRNQMFAQTLNVSKWARKHGIKNLNIDLVYGLPFQTLSGLEDTLQKCLQLSADRVAFYGYAHVPWKCKAQRGFEDHNIPQNEEKLTLYQAGKEFFSAHNYINIGIDHFAKETDELAIAFKNQSLHRNFMGYTVQHSDILIGLGCSAISETPNAYYQNLKNVKEYQECILNEQPNFETGHQLTENEIITKGIIKEIMCSFNTKVDQKNKLLNQKLKPFIKDKLIEMDCNKLRITAKGKPFVRNIATCFDPKQDSKPKSTFSSSI